MKKEKKLSAMHNAKFVNTVRSQVAKHFLATSWCIDGPRWATRKRKPAATVQYNAKHVIFQNLRVDRSQSTRPIHWFRPWVDEFSFVLALWALEVGDESETHYFGFCYHSVGHAYPVVKLEVNLVGASLACMLLYCSFSQFFVCVHKFHL
jgi:hypothetical protein